MTKLRLLQAGLLVYITILVTSFLHVLHSFLQYSQEPIRLGEFTIPGWLGGLGVAIGLDLAVIYFSFVAVVLQGEQKDERGNLIPHPGALSAKQGGVWAMLLVWFAVLYSMVGGHLEAREWVEAGIGLVLSLFVPLTSLRIGQVLGEISKLPEPRKEVGYIPLASVARLLDADVKTVLAAIRGYESGEVHLLRRGKDWLVHPEDVEVVRAAVRDSANSERPAALAAAS